MEGFTLFRNDNHNLNVRPYGGTAIYSQHSFVSSFPLKCNINGIEITTVRLSTLLNVTVIAIYRSPKISVRLLCSSLIEILQNMSFQYRVIIGDFNVNWMNEVERRPLYNLFTQRNYKQLISQYTTDNKTIIDKKYIQTSLIFMFLQESWKHILLITRPFGCPFHFKLIDPHSLSIQNSTWKFVSRSVFIHHYKTNLIKPTYKMFLNLVMQIIPQLCELK